MAGIRILLAATSLAFAATAAHAQVFCGGDGPPCIDPNPPGAPTLPTKPAAVVSYGSVSAKSRDEGVTPTQYVQVTDGAHTTSDGEAYILGAANISAPDSNVSIPGGLLGSASVSSTLMPLASVTAHALAPPGSGGGLGQIGLIYMVSIHAQDDAAAVALAARLGTSGAIATAAGNVSLTSFGQAYSTARITTGDGIFGYSYDFADSLYELPTYNPGLLKRTSFDCDSTGFYLSGGTSGCGANSFTLAVNFTRATNYDGGSSLDFIGNISLLAGVNATGFNGQFGESSAFVDPIVTLAADLDPSLYRLTVGNGDDVGNGGAISAAPEPTAWALMLTGFGLAGAGLRRRRVTA